MKRKADPSCQHRFSPDAPLCPDTLYFGGGTPSLLAPEDAARLIAAASPLPGAEVTLEANPETVTEASLCAFREAGINRISFGVQSARDSQLKTLGRPHIFTDHMFVMNYDAGQGWHDARIVPYGDLSLSPAAMCLHYGQEIFEGLKAYRTADGSVQLFRPQENFKRMNNSAERMVIPKINEEDMLYALKTLVKMEQDWVPHTEGASLYIRPFIIAVDPYVGVKPADHYLFIIILSPSGAYYSTGLNPVKIYVENKYVRAVRGGTGFAKTAANYAISLAGQEEAHEQDYEQVLWLDGVERKYVEEVGSMNIFFVIDGEVVTPQLLGSVLPGITRKSAIEICKKKGYKVRRKRHRR